MFEYIYSRFLSKNISSQHIKKFLTYIGYDYRHWTRPVMHKACTQLLADRGVENFDVLEISSGEYWRTLPFRSYREMNFPKYDICKDTLDGKFNLIIADQVFEHLLWPYQAAKNVYSMLQPGGYFLISTPFLIKYHPIPYDCTRWTETGIKYFLAESGFPLESVITGSWGNRACVKANFNHWAWRGWFGSLKNEPDFPVTVWALAQKL
ncbi:MAG: methyltransferase domain-containing protein [Nitrosomonas sp.]|nr:methyltransferase domain-containing protein [Nitrosomonas sp.]